MGCAEAAAHHRGQGRSLRRCARASFRHNKNQLPESHTAGMESGRALSLWKSVVSRLIYNGHERCNSWCSASFFLLDGMEQLNIEDFKEGAFALGCRHTGGLLPFPGQQPRPFF